LGVAVVLSLPALYRAYRAGRAFTGLLGVREGIQGRDYAPATAAPRKETATKRRSPLGYLSSFHALFLWCPLGVGLNVGQSMSILGLYSRRTNE
jgi:hypothetical protein